MKLLAVNGGMTASGIAREMGLNQSSVSRLLRSLIEAGFVYKPSFQEFALDYGVLSFAGVALRNFPLATTAVEPCNMIHETYGCGAAVAVLHERRLLYLAFVNDEPDSRLRLIDDSSYPIYESSLGLVLSFMRGAEFFSEIIEESMGDRANGEAESLFHKIHDELATFGFFRLPRAKNHRFNSAIPFDYEGRLAALAIFSHTKTFPKDACRRILEDGVRRLGGVIAGGKD